MPTLTFYLKLIGTNPLVTRTFKVSSESSMYVLHHIIQVVMGWKNYHLYQFEVGTMVIADKRLWEEDGMGPVTDVKDVSVGEVFTKVGTTAVYEYDWGGVVGCTTLNWWTDPFTQRKRYYLWLFRVKTHVHLKIVVVYMVIKNYWKY